MSAMLSELAHSGSSRITKTSNNEKRCLDLVDYNTPRNSINQASNSSFVFTKPIHYIDLVYMDIHYEKNGVSFVWNARKAAANPIKHGGISFDPFLKLLDAGRNHESRDAVIGYDEKGRLCILRLKVSLSGLFRPARPR